MEWQGPFRWQGLAVGSEVTQVKALSSGNDARLLLSPGAGACDPAMSGSGAALLGPQGSVYFSA
jgi:hypothetical protein